MNYPFAGREARAVHRAALRNPKMEKFHGLALVGHDDLLRVLAGPCPTGCAEVYGLAGKPAAGKTTARRQSPTRRGTSEPP
jgi:hypothetical protein